MKQTPQALSAISANHDISQKCLRKLQAICGHHTTLPSSYVVSDGLTRVGDGPITVGAIIDAWEGTYCSKKVSIKCLKIPPNDDQTLKKVRIWYPTSLLHPVNNTCMPCSHSSKRPLCGSGWGTQISFLLLESQRILYKSSQSGCQTKLSSSLSMKIQVRIASAWWVFSCDHTWPITLYSQGIRCGQRSQLSSYEQNYTRKLRWGRYYLWVDLDLTDNLWLGQDSYWSWSPCSVDWFRVCLDCSQNELCGTEEWMHYHMGHTRNSQGRWYDYTGSRCLCIWNGCDRGQSSCLAIPDVGDGGLLDIWMVPQVFTGRPPFSESTASDITSKIIDNKWLARPWGLADSAWDITDRCWCQDPAQWPTMTEVVQLLCEWPVFSLSHQVNVLTCFLQLQDGFFEG